MNIVADSVPRCKRRDDSANVLLDAALWYARRGYHILPLKAGTKLPATPHGVKDATDNVAQIRRWWQRWPDANIGIAAGASGLLILDFDTYKTGVLPENVLADEDQNTVISHTPSGGVHVWYRQPAEPILGNATGSLPKGVDVRGSGGYIVAPPSKLLDNRQYRFAPRCKPTDIEVSALPDHVLAALLPAQTAPVDPKTIFSPCSTSKPDLSLWRLSDAILELINTGAPKGERSEASQKVITALARAGADDNAIRAVFVHYAIGEKYGERGDKWLAHSISAARLWLADHPVAPPVAAERLTAARQWVRGPDCLAKLRVAGVRRVADLIPMLDAIVELAQQRRALRVKTTVRDLADLCGLTATTAWRRLARLEAAGFLATTRDEFGTLIDLSPLLDLSETLSTVGYSVSLRSTSFLTDHRLDDAFTSYPYKYAIKRRQAPAALLPSLGAAGLLLWDALQDGGTVKALAVTTGLTVAAVRSTLKRYDQAGLVIIWQEEEDPAKFYELHPNAEERLEERREHMVTAGIGQLRAARNASDRARNAQRKLQGRMPLEPRERVRLENRRDNADEKVDAYYDALAKMGIDPHAQVTHRQPRPYMKIDRKEEWASKYRPLWERWQALVDLTPHDRYRVLAFAGYGRGEIDTALQVAKKGIANNALS